MNIPKPKLVLPIGVLFVAALFGLLLLVTAPVVESVPPDFEPQAIRVMTARPESVQLIVRSQGTVAPRTESALVPEVSGRVVWTSPALVSGGFFAEGDALLRIESSDYETQVTKARAALERARGELEYARRNRKRLDGLAERDIASPSQHDDARRALRVAAAAESEAQANLEQAERDLGRTEIRAPYPGRVRSEQVDVGQFVNRGAVVATIYAIDHADIRLPIPDRQLAYLELPLLGASESPREGPEVTLRARFAGAEHTWTGRVVRTEGEIDSRSRMVHVVARVDDPYGTQEGRDGSGRGVPLAVGLFVRAEIGGPRLDDVVVVPRTALREDGSILVLGDDERLRVRIVEVVRVDREEVLIRDVAAGERICVSPLQVFVEGMRVRAIGGGEDDGLAATGKRS